jgi:hypothetical protein
MANVALDELKRALQHRFPDALPLGRGTAVAVSTGLPSLDMLLPGGGLVRGRLTSWRPGGGATAVLRSACAAAVQRGERAAWVDGAAVQGADGWRAGPLLVRPSSGRAALESTEELLRSGGFALVVLTGADREVAGEAVRLTRSARSGGAALVVVTAESTVAHLRVRTRLIPEAYRWRRDAFGEPVEVETVRVEVEASSLGWSGRTGLDLPVRSHAARLAPEPRLVDRRGAPPAARWRRARQGKR